MSAAIKVYVGTTDLDWFYFLAQCGDVEEVNFWQPGGRTQFGVLRPGELILFKLHSPNNVIVGGGLFGHGLIVPISLAWDASGPMKGAASLDEMRQRIARYRREPVDPRADHAIGCRILEGSVANWNVRKGRVLGGRRTGPSDGAGGCSVTSRGDALKVRSCSGRCAGTAATG